MITEADTCRKCVFPKPIQGGWDDDPFIALLVNVLNC